MDGCLAIDSLSFENRTMDILNLCFAGFGTCLDLIVVVTVNNYMYQYNPEAGILIHIPFCKNN
jgi:hypothetical protein